LLASEDQTLLVGRDTFFVLDLCFNVLNGIGRFDFQGDGLPSESLDEDLHTTAETKHQVECGLFLDIVIGKSSAIFQLLSSEDKTLLIGRNT